MDEITFQAHGEAIAQLLQQAFGAGEQATNALQQTALLSERVGYYRVLLELAMCETLDQNVRLISIICFKNSVEERWAAASTQEKRGIPQQEKNQIRELILGCFFSHSLLPSMISHLALAISFIARRDFPTLWPSLLPTLLQHLQKALGEGGQVSGEAVKVLLLLHHILKKLASRSLPTQKRQMHQIGPEIINTMLNLARVVAEEVTSTIRKFFDGQTPAQTIANTEPSALALKYTLKIMGNISKNLLPSELASMKGGNGPEFPPLVSHYIQFCYSVLESFWALLQPLDREFPLRELLHKMITYITKTTTAFLNRNPTSFAPSLSPFLQHYTNTLISSLPSSSPSSSLRSYLTSSCGFVVLALDRTVYDTALVSLKDPAKGMVNGVVDQVFLNLLSSQNEQGGQTCAQVLLHHLVCNYFPLSLKELEEWIQNPEEYFLSTEYQLDLWKNELKGASQMVGSVLLSRYSEITAKAALSLLSSSISNDPSEQPSWHSALIRDAVYLLLGQNMTELFDHVPEEWLTNFLPQRIQYLSSIGTMEALLEMRRCLWVIGKWVGKVRTNRTPLYHTFQAVLSLPIPPDSENEEEKKRWGGMKVVGLESCLGLKRVIEDSWFDVHVFAPFSGALVPCLFDHLNRCEGVDAKMQILGVLTVIVDRCASHLTSLASQMFHYFLKMWMGCGAHQHMRLSLLDAFVPLVNALSFDIENHMEVICGMIIQATSPDDKDFVFLVESGLRLWEASLENIPKPNLSIQKLFSHLEQLLHFTYDGLPFSLSVLQSYICIPCSNLMKEGFGNIVGIFQICFRDVDRDEGRQNVLQTFDQFVQVAFSESEAFPIPEQRNSDGFIGLLHKTFEIAFSETETYTCVEIAIGTLCRILIKNANFFFALVQSLPPGLAVSFLDLLLNKLDNISGLVNRKLVALAMCSFFGTGQDFAVERLSLIMHSCVNVILDLNDPEKKFGFDSFVLEESEDASDPIVFRGKAMLCRGDPAFVLSIQGYFAQKAEECARARSVSPQQFFDQCDPKLLSVLFPR